MGAMGRLVRRMELLLRRGKFRSDLTEEMRFHREEVEREIAESGVSDAEARSAARRPRILVSAIASTRRLGRRCPRSSIRRGPAAYRSSR